jgi:diguanylate cyclase (GGDEF)-like protein
VFGSARIERSSAINSATAVQEAQRLLTAMLDQETGARGYFVTRDPVFLQPWYGGTSNFAVALAAARKTGSGDRGLQADLATQAGIAHRWHDATAAGIASFRRSARRTTPQAALAGKALMDSFRTANAHFMRDLERRRDASLSRATWLSVVLAGGLSLALSIAALLLLRRSRLRETRRQRREAEFRELLQASPSEEESRQVLIRHIKGTIPDTGVAVLNRNNSDDRLELTVSDAAHQTPLRDLPEARFTPQDCLAVRLSRPHKREAEESPLGKCELCGRLAADIACEPLLVGGQVIGSVLAAKHGQIKESEQAHLRSTVMQAAPIIANQRNLSLAETRAATDSLTALPNRRAADDTLKRMVAQAIRATRPMSAVLLDLDHFKQINDVHGHDQGDEALAAVGSILFGSLRASDFAARYGGEEFLVLLPDTARAQACVVAEKLRLLIERSEIRPGRVTASFGVATLPDDAGTADDLIRQADRALYAAKHGGRNRVQTAEADSGRVAVPLHPGQTAASVRTPDPAHGSGELSYPSVV